MDVRDGIGGKQGQSRISPWLFQVLAGLENVLAKTAGSAHEKSFCHIR
jgi:hypothetical protein